jgi:hypothetical protein
MGGDKSDVRAASNYNQKPGVSSAQCKLNSPIFAYCRMELLSPESVIISLPHKCM